MRFVQPAKPNPLNLLREYFPGPLSARCRLAVFRRTVPRVKPPDKPCWQYPQIQANPFRTEIRKARATHPLCSHPSETSRMSAQPSAHQPGIEHRHKAQRPNRFSRFSNATRKAVAEAYLRGGFIWCSRQAVPGTTAGNVRCVQASRFPAR